MNRYPSEHGLHEARALGIVVERLTDFANGCVDSLCGIQENLFAPESLNDFFPADEPIPVLHEKDEEFHWNLFKLQY